MSNLKLFLIVFLVSLLFIYAAMWYQETTDVLKELTNATFFSGVMIIGPGLLIFIANGGLIGSAIFFVTKGIYKIIGSDKYYYMNYTIYNATRNSVPPFTYLVFIIIGLAHLITSYTLLYLYF